MDKLEERLFASYVQDGSESAFRQIVDRYGDLVYNAAYRRLRDHQLAEDAAQATFIILAKKAAKIRKTTMLGGWFWRTATNVARNIERERVARAKRERETIALDRNDPDSAWERMAPDFDAALAAVPAQSRALLIGRYLQGKPLQELAGELGLHASTVHRRISNALLKLRHALRRRGVAVAPALLASLLSTRTTEAVSIEVCDSIHRVAFGISGGSMAAEGAAYAAARGVLRMMMWAKIRVAAVGLTVAAGLGGGAAAVAVKNRPIQGAPALITPAPRKMTMAGRALPVTHGAIVLACREPKLKIAAQEINQRLTGELLREALPVKTGGPANLGSSPGLTIVIGVSGREQMATLERSYPVKVPAKTEGYGITMHRRGGRTVVMLAGHDAQGALYAAVTLRYLLDTPDRTGIPNGKVVLHLATVEDWPDWRWREIGDPPSPPYWKLYNAVQKGDAALIEAAGRVYEERNKQYVDYLLRRKVNVTESHLGHYQKNLKMNHTEIFRRAKAVGDYAAARGIEFESGHIHTNPYEHEFFNKESGRQCIWDPRRKRYHCWSRIDRHKERANEFAQAFKRGGITWFFLHDVDSGGWLNPALWNDRCDECRAMFGEDYARAVATVYNIYYDTFIEQVPNGKMIACMYPYYGLVLDVDAVEKTILRGRRAPAAEEARRLAEERVRWYRTVVAGLNRRLRPAIKICFREESGKHWNMMSELYGKRDFEMYALMPHMKGWEPEFTMENDSLKTWLRPGHEDVFWAMVPKPRFAFTELFSAEFAWNVNTPGACEYPGWRVRDIEHHIEPRDVAVKWIEKHCANLFGREIGPHMVPLFDSNISYPFIHEPAKKAQAMRLKDERVTELMQEMAVASARAAAALEKARAVYDAAVSEGRRPIPDPIAERYFGSAYRYALATRCVAGFRARMLQARAATIANDGRTAQRLADEMRALIATEKKAWAARRSWMESVPYFTRLLNKNNFYHKIHDYDYSVLEKELDEFIAEGDKLFAAHNTPKWFEQMLRTRTLEAVPAARAPVVDGKLNEPVWNTAPANRHFVHYKTSRPAEKQTEARILYDARALYVGFTVHEPGADKLTARTRGRDAIDKNHCVELFVAPGPDKRAYVHFIWDIAGQGQGTRQGKPFTSKARCAIATYPDGWTMEAVIPAEDLGTMPSAGALWHANLCRNLRRADGTREEVSTALLEGARFHSPEKFVPLRFLRRPPAARKPVVAFRADEERAGLLTIDTGQGFEAVFDLYLDTTQPLHNASLTAQVASDSRRQDDLAVFRGKNIPLLWRTRRPIRYQIDTPEPGLAFVFRLKADEGEWTFRKLFGTPRVGLK